MAKAGLNPILAVTGGGIGTSIPGGTAASVGGAQMSSAQSEMASGGLLGANAASENNYTGQMEQMSSTGRQAILTQELAVVDGSMIGGKENEAALNANIHIKGIEQSAQVIIEGEVGLIGVLTAGAPLMSDDVSL